MRILKPFAVICLALTANSFGQIQGNVNRAGGAPIFNAPTNGLPQGQAGPPARGSAFPARPAEAPQTNWQTTQNPAMVAPPTEQTQLPPSGMAPRSQQQVPQQQLPTTAGVPRQAPATNQPAPIPSKQSEFSIPFRVQRVGPDVFVELHVSADQGQNWRLYSRQPSSLGRFKFRAPVDGEYWFSSRTVVGNQRVGGNEIRPELRVLVDTRLPELKINAHVATDGKVTVSWDAFDEHLAHEHTAVEHQGSQSQPWQKLQLDGEERLARRSKGKLDFYPKEGEETVLIRVAVRDSAGNVAAKSHRLFLPKIARRDSPEAKSLAGGNIPWNDGGAARAPSAQPMPTVAREPAQARPPVRNQLTTHKPSTGQFGSLAAQEVRQSVASKSRRFHLNYDVSQVGPEGPEAVELWVSRDLGQTWKKWGEDADRKSPLLVHVDREGTYGFRMVVIGKSGHMDARPADASDADIWVNVDTTAPMLRLTDVSMPKNGPNAGRVQIVWNARDEALGAKPVRIQYRGDGSSDWNDIVKATSNSGIHVWTPGREVPMVVTLRIEVRDKAGNVTVQQREGVHLRPQAPSGKIMSVTPAQ